MKITRATTTGLALTGLLSAASYAGAGGLAVANTGQAMGKPAPSPTPSPTPTTGENGCRDVIGGALFWHQDKITNSSGVEHGASGAMSVTAYLAAPSCVTTDYKINVYNAQGGLVFSNSKTGTGERSDIHFDGVIAFGDPSGVDLTGAYTCVQIQVQTIQDAVVQDTAPDSGTGFQVCDDKSSSPGGTGFN